MPRANFNPGGMLACPARKVSPRTADTQAVTAECSVIIQPTNMGALTWAGAAAGTLSEPWRVGSVLAGRLLERTALTRYVLQIGNVTVEADAPDSQPLPRQFQARVLSNGSTPLLEVVESQGGSHSPLNNLLRAQLPRQGGYAPVLADLAAVARHPSIRELPPSIRYALATLEAAVRSPSDLSAAQGLKQAVARSGLFFEHDLWQAVRTQPETLPDALADDWKAALLRLRRVLEQRSTRGSTAASGRQVLADTAPPLRSRPLLAQPRWQPPPGSPHPLELLDDMQTHVTAALSRLEIAQVETHPAQLGPVACLVELPVHGSDGYDVVQMRIEREPDPAQPQSVAPWTLGFSVDIPALGPIQAEITVQAGQVNVRFWAERQETLQRLQTGMPTLRDRLRLSELTLQHVQCRQGMPQASGYTPLPLFEASA